MWGVSLRSFFSGCRRSVYPPLSADMTAVYQRRDVLCSTKNKLNELIMFFFLPSFITFPQVQQRLPLLGNCQALFCSTLPPPSGKVQLLHLHNHIFQCVAWLPPVCDFTISPAGVKPIKWAWRNDLCTKHSMRMSSTDLFSSLYCRCVLEVQIWPSGSGGPVALQEREVSVLPQAHADERRRPDHRSAERGPRSHCLCIIHR